VHCLGIEERQQAGVISESTLPNQHHAAAQLFPLNCIPARNSYTCAETGVGRAEVHCQSSGASLDSAAQEQIVCLNQSCNFKRISLKF
jgi:hypothetical protein